MIKDDKNVKLKLEIKLDAPCEAMVNDMAIMVENRS